MAPRDQSPIAVDPPPGAEVTKAGRNPRGRWRLRAKFSHFKPGQPLADRAHPFRLIPDGHIKKLNFSSSERKAHGA